MPVKKILHQQSEKVERPMEDLAFTRSKLRKIGPFEQKLIQAA